MRYTTTMVENREAGCWTMEVREGEVLVGTLSGDYLAHVTAEMDLLEAYFGRVLFERDVTDEEWDAAMDDVLTGALRDAPAA